jgi:hypothetical protein
MVHKVSHLDMLAESLWLGSMHLLIDRGGMLWLLLSPRFIFDGLLYLLMRLEN